MQAKAKTQKKAQGENTLRFSSMESSKLMELFERELKDIYWVEKTLIKAIPKMIKNASSEELIEVLEEHLEAAERHLAHVEEVFELAEIKPVAKKCVAMQGLLEEGNEHIREADEGAMRDAVIIVATQKIKHYEIASYGTLCAFAQLLELEEAAEVLESILEEEKIIDEKLTEVALLAVNLDASEEVYEETDEEEDTDEETEDDSEGEEETTGEYDDDDNEDEENTEDEEEVEDSVKEKTKNRAF